MQQTMQKNITQRLSSLRQRASAIPSRLINRGTVLAGSLLAATPAHAAGSIDSISSALQGLLDILSGDAAQITGGIAIAGLGYMWLSGHMTLVKAASIAFGVGLILGAPDIVDALQF